MLNSEDKDVICVLLAGGQGSRLYPLTADHAKPSVPFGGKYRIIDFTLSNCLHSGIRRVLVLTQYKSHSLQKHLRDAWSVFSPELGEYITAIPPQMRTGESWYSGTADSIFQNLYLLERSGANRVVILSADHVYRMDYAAMLQNHNDLGADLSVACMRVPLNEASSFGIMSVDGSGSVTAFQEKPTDPSPMEGVDDAALASMGIYIFNTDILIEELTNDHADRSSSHDFGNDILPRMIKSHKVCGYQFGSSQGRVTPDRYWRDVGTIDSYFDANMDLLQTEPPLDLYQDTWPIRTYHGQHPPARVVTSGHIDHAGIHNSILGAGSMVIDAAVKRSILSARVRVGANADLDSAIVFDHASIGEGAKLNRCIVDKYVTIPAGTIIGYDKEEDEKRYTVSAKGVVVVSGQS